MEKSFKMFTNNTLKYQLASGETFMCMKIKIRRMLGFGFILMGLLIVLMLGNEAYGATVYLTDIDSEFSSPTGYRWLDVAGQAYSEIYRST